MNETSSGGETVVAGGGRGRHGGDGHLSGGYPVVDGGRLRASSGTATSLQIRRDRSRSRCESGTVPLRWPPRWGGSPVADLPSPLEPSRERSGASCSPPP